ncbi:MAG: tail fiber domain-containing protein [Bacteroidota bacterium]
MKKLLQLFFAAALLLLSSLSTLHAQTNLSVQGTIQNFNGSAVDNGQYDVIFKLYTVETGGTAVWTETQSVQVTGGVYSALLGSVNPLMVAFDQTYYLGITLPGGPELTPRSRLTSSPYALSVIGQTNIFPSTGAVGAGTATPTAGYQLHTKNASGAGKVLVEGSSSAQLDLKGTAGAAKLVVEGSTGASIDFKKGANTASITYDGTNINVDNLNLSSFNPATLAVTSKLAVGQGAVDANNAFKVVGKTYLNGFVEISGSQVLASGQCAVWNGGGGTGSGGSQNVPFSMKASNFILAQEYWAYSDRRIKKDFHLSENLADLSTLKKLRVTDYRHIDEMTKGTNLKKGFIAQEVETAFPEAVITTSDFIPNVYAVSSQTKLSAGQMTISLNKSHGFTVGDEVKLMMPDNSERKLTVKSVPSETTFSVIWEEAAPAEVFVYGKKVDDFHTVDYDRIFTLNVSATQELARRVEQLEAENAQLRAHNNGLQQKTDRLQQQNEELRSDLNGLGERLLKLEKRGSGSLEK